jgi:hypothetical protein
MKENKNDSCHDADKREKGQEKVKYVTVVRENGLSFLDRLNKFMTTCAIGTFLIAIILALFYLSSLKLVYNSQIFQQNVSIAIQQLNQRIQTLEQKIEHTAKEGKHVEKK